MQGMTGFGKAIIKNSDSKIIIQCRSLNNRFLNIKTNLPEYLSDYSYEIDKIVKKVVHRGSIFINITIESVTPKSLIDVYTLKKNYHLLLRAKKELGFEGKIPFESLLQLPEILSVKEKIPNINNKNLYLKITKGLNIALNKMLIMRGKEGKNINKAVLRKLSIIRRLTQLIKKRFDKASPLLRKKLRYQIQGLLGGTPYENSSTEISKKISLFAEAHNIAEEIQRLLFHISQFMISVTSDKDIGKKLVFISQEMLREANTICSKTNDTLIAKHAIAIKVEVEKIRELIENVE